jgi:hypothetical protein
MRSRKPGTQGKACRAGICLATTALLGVIAYYNISFVYYRSHAAAQVQLATEARAAPNRRYQGASDALLHADNVVTAGGAAAAVVESAPKPDAARGAAPAAAAATLNGVALSPAAVARRAAALAAQKAAADAATAAGCKPLRPFHTLLTAQSTTYQNWQVRDSRARTSLERGRARTGEGRGAERATPDSERHAALSRARARPSTDTTAPSRLPKPLLPPQSTRAPSLCPQARIMYFHFLKQRAAAGACGEMGGFTRIVAHGTGEPDGLEAEIPSIFVTEYTPAELARFKHFAVMNRPFSVKQMLASAELMAGFVEDYVMIAETGKARLLGARGGLLHG